MRKILLWLGGVLVVGLMAAMWAGWWFLSFDVPDEPGLPGERVTGALQWDGLERSWRAYLPSDLEPGAPLMLLLHGSRGQGSDLQMMTAYGFDVLAERKGVVTVYPDGIERHWNDCRASASYAANTRNIDDVGFLRALVAELQGRYATDPARVYVVGMSNGGHMAYRMGMESPGELAGIAAFVANLPVAENLDCAPAGAPLPVLIVNGTEDPVNPFDGGVVELLGDTSRGEVLSALASARYWAELAGYSSEGQHSDWPDRVPEDGTTIAVQQWLGAGRPPVALVSVVGGGHTMPDPVFRLPRILGRTSHEADSARMVWQFFSEGALLQPPVD